MAVTIKLKRGTAAQWAAANTVLEEGELGLETDSGKIKVGDGATAWNTQPYNVSSGRTVGDITVGTPAAASGSGGVAYDGASATITYTPPDIPSLETTTSIAKVGNNLEYTDEDGTVTTIDLTPYLDDTNLSRLVSGEMNPDSYIATFTRDDASSFDIDFSPLLDTGLDGDLTGSVFGDDSTLLVDGINNIIPAGVIDGALADSNIAQSNVTQHQAALSITESQISDLQSYLTSYTETNDLTSAVVWANIPDVNVPQSAVTQHQAALSITESQISDLQSYLTVETNDLSAAVVWANVPDANITQSSVTQHQAALSITESQISDLQSYLLDITGENIEQLSNVNNTGLANNDVLAWNASASEWQPATNGSDVYLVDGGTATSIYTSGDLELDGGGA